MVRSARSEGEWLVVRLSGLSVGKGFTVYGSGFRIMQVWACDTMSLIYKHVN